MNSYACTFGLVSAAIEVIHKSILFRSWTPGWFFQTTVSNDIGDIIISWVVCNFACLKLSGVTECVSGKDAFAVVPRGQIHTMDQAQSPDPVHVENKT